jgi:hypothetical protein
MKSRDCSSETGIHSRKLASDQWNWSGSAGEILSVMLRLSAPMQTLSLGVALPELQSAIDRHFLFPRELRVRSHQKISIKPSMLRATSQTGHGNAKPIDYRNGWEFLYID